MLLLGKAVIASLSGIAGQRKRERASIRVVDGIGALGREKLVMKLVIHGSQTQKPITLITRGEVTFHIGAKHQGCIGGTGVLVDGVGVLGRKILFMKTVIHCSDTSLGRSREQKQQCRQEENSDHVDVDVAWGTFSVLCFGGPACFFMGASGDSNAKQT